MHFNTDMYRIVCDEFCSHDGYPDDAEKHNTAVSLMRGFRYVAEHEDRMAEIADQKFYGSFPDASIYMLIKHMLGSNEF